MLSLLAGGPALDQAFFAEQPPGKSIPVVTVASSINPGVAEFVLRQIAKAEKENAPALVIQLDTPGGLDTSMRTIVQGLLNAQIPVVVFVSPSGARAASAGVMIVLAADVAAMAPGTNIGAASPVNIGGKDIEKTMARKVENDMVAYVRSIAAQRQRNADWAASAVLKSESLPAEKALELKVIDLLAKDLPDLLQKIDGLQVTTGKQPKVLRTKGTPTTYVQEGFRDRVLKTISDPNIAYLLMMLGTMGIFFELMNPGNIFPGVIGGISLILAFFALQTLPVNYAGILLILLAIIFFIAEIKVISHGLLSIGGVISLTLGSLLLFRTADSHLGVALGVLIPVVFDRFRIFPGCSFPGHQGLPEETPDRRPGDFGRSRPGKPTHPPGGPGKGLCPRGDLERPVRGRPGNGSDRGSGRDRSFAADRKKKGWLVHRILHPFSEEDRMYTLAAIIVLVIFFLSSAIRILNEYERGVIFRLGRVIAAKGPGLIILIPIIDKMIKVDLRTVTMDVPAQDVITRDNVSVKVNAVVYFRVMDAVKATVEVQQYLYATSQLAQTTLRSVCGQAELDKILSEREKVNTEIQEILDAHTDPWGIKVSVVEVKQIDLPQEMQRAMAKQAEAERERRAKVINAEGEFQAAARLAEAAAIIADHPIALQLRYLQTLREVASENNSTTLFPIPIDLFKPFIKLTEMLEAKKG